MVYIKVKKKFESAFHAGRWPHGNVLCIIDITPILALNEKRSHSSDCETIFFFFSFLFKPRERREISARTLTLSYRIKLSNSPSVAHNVVQFVHGLDCARSIESFMLIRNRGHAGASVPDLRLSHRCTIAKYDGEKGKRKESGAKRVER